MFNCGRLGFAFHLKFVGCVGAQEGPNDCLRRQKLQQDQHNVVVDRSAHEIFEEGIRRCPRGMMKLRLFLAQKTHERPSLTKAEKVVLGNACVISFVIGGASGERGAVEIPPDIICLFVNTTIDEIRKKAAAKNSPPKSGTRLKEGAMIERTAVAV